MFVATYNEIITCLEMPCQAADVDQHLLCHHVFFVASTESPTVQSQKNISFHWAGC